MPPVRDLVLAAAVAVALQLDLWFLEDARGPRWVTAATALALAGALALRRRRPLAMVVVVTGAIVVQALLDGWLTSMLTTAVAAMVVTFSVAAHAGGRLRALGGAGLLLAGTWADLALSGQEGSDIASDVVFTSVVVVGLPWLAGRALRERTERARALEDLTRELAAEREQTARIAVLDERNRIAREMHDVVAHSVSLMVVQAGAARRMLDSDPDRSRTALLAVESAGRDALAELRRVLGVLRGSPERVALEPQPGTAQLASLVESIRGLGLDVDLVHEGTPREVPPGVELTAYRVVQEALTNAVKHAGDARARVAVRWRSDALEVEVVDDGSGVVAPPASGSGHGIAGMRERVAVYGGDVEAGPAPRGGFAVRARIPLDGALA